MPKASVSSRPAKDPDAPTNGAHGFNATLLEPLVVHFGEPLWVSVRRAAEGVEWVAPVFSKDDVPSIPDELGGDAQNAKAPPRTAVEAVYRELRRVWESDDAYARQRLMAAGFVLGVRKPFKPGGHAESWEETAARLRRVGGDLRGNSTRKLLDRARLEGLRSGGDWTERGDAVLANVDRAKAAIRDVLENEPTIWRHELTVKLNRGIGRRPRAGRFDGDGRPLQPCDYAISEMATEAAIGDLEAMGEVRYAMQTCSDEDCPGYGKNHLALTRGAS